MLSTHLPEAFFPITTCKHCGAAVRRLAERLYRIDTVVIHTCTPPPPPALTIDEAPKT